MERKEQNSIWVIIVGLVLIFLVTAFILLRPFLKKDPAVSQKVLDNSVYLEDLKRAQKITSEELRTRILTEKDVVILDLRDANSFVKEHILDSRSLPLADLANSLESLDKSKTYVLVDDGSGLQAAYAAGGIFTQNNFENVFYLSGGFVAWKNKVNLTVSAGDPTSFVDQSKVKYIGVDDLKKVLETESNLLVIDVREKNDFDGGHLKNASNIPLANLEKDRYNIAPGKRIILYDENGYSAFQAGVRLYDLGFLNVWVFSDGLRVWRDRGYEIIK